MRDRASQRLQKAGRAIQSARRELDAGEPEFAADRAYYALFYVAEALLAERGLLFRSHGAVHGAFGKEYAKPRDLDPKYHGWLLRAFEARQRASYGADFEAELAPDAVGETIRRAEEFLEAARAHLEAQR